MISRIHPTIEPDMPHAFRVCTADELARLLGYNPYAINIKGYKEKHPKTISYIHRKLKPERV